MVCLGLFGDFIMARLIKARARFFD